MNPLAFLLTSFASPSFDLIDTMASQEPVPTSNKRARGNHSSPSHSASTAKELQHASKRPKVNNDETLASADMPVASTSASPSTVAAQQAKEEPKLSNEEWEEILSKPCHHHGGLPIAN